MSSCVQRLSPSAQLGRRLSSPAPGFHHHPIPCHRPGIRIAASPHVLITELQLFARPAEHDQLVAQGGSTPGLGTSEGRGSSPNGAGPTNTYRGDDLGGTGCGCGCGGGSGGGGGGSRRRGHGFGDGGGWDPDQDPDSHPRRPSKKFLQMLVAAAATITGLDLVSPALAQNSTSTAQANTDSLPTAATASDGHGGGVAPAASLVPALGAATAGGTAADTARVKRLLREVFVDLTEVRARLDAMDAAAADAAAAEEDALVVPLEGLAVRPYARALAAGMRLRSRAQVSGWVDAPAFLPLLATEHRREPQPQPQPQQPSSSRSPSPVDAWGDMMRGAVGALLPAAGPQLRLRVQSLWGGGAAAATGASAPSTSSAPTSASAAAPASPSSSSVTTSRAGPGAQAQGGRRQGPGADKEGSQPVVAHLQTATAPDGQSVVLDKLLLKAEAHPKLRLMLAARGSLENIGMNVNPFAGAGELQRGLTAAARRGHDLELFLQGGAGAAAAAKTGNVSAAVGAFTSSGWTDPPAAGGMPASTFTAAAAAGGTTTTTCAQLSLHQFQRFVLTAAWASSAPSSTPFPSSDSPLRHSSPPTARSSPSSSPPPSLPAAATAAAAGPAAVAAPDLPGSLARRGLTGPGSAAGGPAASAASSCIGSVGGGDAGSCRRLQRGLIGAVQLGDRLSAAVWLGDAVSTLLDGGCGRTSNRTGIGSDGDSGCGPLGPWADAQPAAVDGPMGPIWRQRRMGLRLARLPDEDTGRSYVLSVSHRRTAAYGEGTRLLVAEASAALPLANGVVVTPGVVVLRRSDQCTVRTLLGAAAQTTWMF